MNKRESEIKGKLNKIKIGQKVQVKLSCVEWYATHLSWCYGRSASGLEGYGQNEKEIYEEDLQKVYFWSKAYLSKKSPIGKVLNYGARDNDKGEDRKHLFVEFSLRTKFGVIKESSYFSEESLQKTKKK